jgi:hypothetical protein
MRPQSGSAGRGVAAERIASAAADLASSLAAVVSDSSAAAAERVHSGETPDHEIKNPWNLFQRKNRNRGWSPATMAKMYDRHKKVSKP